MLTSPLIFSVQHFCVHDGPGIRSVVFFKGCPLRCSWCQNPESWSKAAELGYKEHACLQCTTCVSTCPTGAMHAPGHWNNDACTRCFRCVDICPGGALTRFGEFRSPENILHELSQEFALFRQSQGGVTFSGGEATLFPAYLAKLLPALKAEGIPTALETCGLFHLKAAASVAALQSSEAEWQKFSAQTLWQVLSRLDLILFDLKLMDNQLHRQHCGSSNRRILQNFSLLSGLAQTGLGPKVWPRLPLVPGITDHPDNLHAIAHFLQQNGVTVITLLPYHNLGVDKYNWLHIPIKFDHAMLGDDALQQATQILQACGIRCYTSGEEDYAQLYGEASSSIMNNGKPIMNKLAHSSLCDGQDQLGHGNTLTRYTSTQISPPQKRTINRNCSPPPMAGYHLTEPFGWRREDCTLCSPLIADNLRYDNKPLHIVRFENIRRLFV